ncbi:O-antigen translocase [Morganella morganii]|uniref:O-antigen translocase n=1 Tax=Morganella morganii TaxID=582 RepID=UPI0034D45846
MTLIKTSILSLIATFFKMLSGLVINKAVAVYIGPAGLALIGQFQSFSQIALIAAQGAINNGVVKYSAEYENDKDKSKILISNAIKITIITSIITGIILIVFSCNLSLMILSSIEYYKVFIIFGVAIVFFSINNLLLSILNGRGNIKLFIKINIIQSIYSLIFTSILIYYFNLIGALAALATNQSIICFISIYIIRKNKLIYLSDFRKKTDSTIIRNLLSYSMMAIASAISLPTANLIIRNYITSKEGLTETGYWQGVNYISTTYLLVITTALSIYYLPKLSKIHILKDLKREILLGYTIVIPIVIISSLIIYISRDIIIYAVFSPDFNPMLHLLKWQLLGDIIKMTSWLLSYLLLAKKMTARFVISEILFSIIYTTLSISLIDKYHTIGAIYAYTISYCLYFFIILSSVYAYIKNNNRILST